MNKYIFLLAFLLFGCEDKKVPWKKTSNSEFHFKQSKHVSNLRKMNVPEVVFGSNFLDIRYGKIYIDNVCFGKSDSNIKILKLSDNDYLVGNNENSFSVFKIKSGEKHVLLKGDLESPLGSGIKYFDKLVVGSTNGNIKVYDEKFNLLWERNGSGNIGLINSLRCKDGKIILVCSNGDIVALDLVNGEELWSYMTHQDVESFDLFVGNKIVTRINRKIIMLDTSGKSHEREVSDLHKILYDGNDLICTIIDNEVILFSIDGFEKGEFISKYKLDGELFMYKNVIFSLSESKELFAYTYKKTFIKQYEKTITESMIHNLNHGNMFIS